MHQPHEDLDVWPDAISFGADAAAVIAIRCGRIACGEATFGEVQLMVSEKVAAFALASLSLITGRYGLTPHSVFRGAMEHYATGVRANRVRLTSPA